MVDNLKQVTDEQRHGFADIRSATIIQPIGQGIYRIQLSTGERVNATAAIGSASYAPGTVVTIGTRAGDRYRVILGLPGSSGLGAAVFGGSESAANSSGSVVVLAASPATVLPGGVDQVVYLAGIGFLETPLTTFRAVTVTDGVVAADPLVDIHDELWIADPDAEGVPVADGVSLIKVLVDVDAAATVDYDIQIQAEGGTI